MNKTTNITQKDVKYTRTCKSQDVIFFSIKNIIVARLNVALQLFIYEVKIGKTPIENKRPCKVYTIV